MAGRKPSTSLLPGTVIRWGGIGGVVLARRKKPDDDHHGLGYLPGWWLADDRGGLADSVLDHPTSQWEILQEPIPGYERTPDTTDQLELAVRAALDAHPTERFGQILVNAGLGGPEMFSRHDEAICRRLEQYAQAPHSESDHGRG